MRWSDGLALAVALIGRKLSDRGLYCICAHSWLTVKLIEGLFVCAGELGKLEVVHEGILHKCIQQLLEKKKSFTVTDQAEDLECLCQIMKTVGKRLDTPKAKVSSCTHNTH